MEIKVINSVLTVCKVSDYTQINLDIPYVFIGKTDEENSLVCPTEYVPANTLKRDDGWKAFRIQGILDFSLIGVLSKITLLLAENHISVFAVSTYNTDYILVKQDSFNQAVSVLESGGYHII